MISTSAPICPTPCALRTAPERLAARGAAAAGSAINSSATRDHGSLRPGFQFTNCHLTEEDRSLARMLFHHEFRRGADRLLRDLIVHFDRDLVSSRFHVVQV